MGVYGIQGSASPGLLRTGVVRVWGSGGLGFRVFGGHGFQALSSSGLGASKVNKVTMMGPLGFAILFQPLVLSSSFKSVDSHKAGAVGIAILAIVLVFDAQKAASIATAVT